MKVTILEPSGYCSGVDRAINLALSTKEKCNDKPVVVLGMLVHNEETLKTLQNAGILSIYDGVSSLEELAKSIKEPSKVILTAHGHSKNVEKILIENGHEIVDATCPFVSHSFEEIKAFDDDVFYIGVKNHPEANAALSISEKTHLIESNNPIIPECKSNSPLIISQTTLSHNEVERIEQQILNAYPNAKLFKGVCNASTLRQEALKNIPADVDGIFVVGGTNSNNSKTLFNLAKSLYPNKFVKLIQNSTDINEKDLLGLHHIAISSGASTPKEVIEQIKFKLLN